MRAGQLNQRVTLQQKTAGKDDWGQSTEAWTGVATIWANVRFLNGAEFIKNGVEQQQATASIRIRRRAVDASMRVLHQGVAYDITAVLPGPRNEYIDLAVSAVK